MTYFQSLAHRYEQEAEEARRLLKEAQGNPNLQLAVKTFGTEAALDHAQQRLDYAVRRGYRSASCGRSLRTID